MNLRDRLNETRREYRKEADRLDQRIDEAENKADQGLEKIELEMQATALRLDQQIQAMAVAIKDQFGAVVESIHQLRADQREVSRTMSGRSRLLEDRFGKMIELVETDLDDTVKRADLAELEQRLQALESRIDPAA